MTDGRTEIHVNGRDKYTVKKQLEYWEIVKLAFADPIRGNRTNHVPGEVQIPRRKSRSTQDARGRSTNRSEGGNDYHGTNARSVIAGPGPCRKCKTSLSGGHAADSRSDRRRMGA